MPTKKSTPEAPPDAKQGEPQPFAVRVVVSHDGLNVGDQFPVTEDLADWVGPRLAAGYLQRVEGVEDADEGSA